MYESGAGNKDYQAAKKLYDAELDKRTKEKENLTRFSERYENALATIKAKTGVTITKAEELALVPTDNTNVAEAVAFLKKLYVNGFSAASLQRAKKRNAEFIDYYLNPNFNPRETAGDNPNDITDNHYGNGDVIHQKRCIPTSFPNRFL